MIKNNDFWEKLILEGKLSVEEYLDKLSQFNTSLCKCQSEINPVKKDKAAYTWRYAPWEVIREKTKDILEKHELSLLQFHSGPIDNIVLTSILRHNNGYYEIYESPIAADFSSIKNKLHHEVAGAITFYKRQVYNNLFGIATPDYDSEDIDHKQETKSDLINPKQVSLFNRKAIRYPEIKEAIFKTYKITTPEQIKWKYFNTILEKFPSQ